MNAEASQRLGFSASAARLLPGALKACLARTATDDQFSRALWAGEPAPEIDTALLGKAKGRPIWLRIA